jgi:hypothetical protein
MGIAELFPLRKQTPLVLRWPMLISQLLHYHLYIMGEEIDLDSSPYL